MKQVFNKSRIYPLLLAIAVFIVFKYRENKELKKIELMGTTMGTTYAIKYIDDKGINYQHQIDSILDVFNKSLSTYIPDSEISRFNSEAEFEFKSPFFLPVLQKSKEIYELTNGAFDPTIGPLVNAWGFGPKNEKAPDSLKVQKLLELVDFQKIEFNNQKVTKLNPEIYLDFSAIAKGYGVDIVAEFLSSKNIDNMMVEIGGEVVCKGLNFDKKEWAIGIDKPGQEGSLQAVVKLKNRAIATSGNYRNFYEHNGKKYAHTINPNTGYPIYHNLLSASVFSSDCMSADAFATAFMVMGLEKSKEILDNNKDLDALLIYADEKGDLKTYITDGAKDFINL